LKIRGNKQRIDWGAVSIAPAFPRGVSIAAGEGKGKRRGRKDEGNGICRVAKSSAMQKGKDVFDVAGQKKRGRRARKRGSKKGAAQQSTFS